MKLLKKLTASSYIYRGYTIYDDAARNLWYIYTEPKGKGRVDFSIDTDAEEYIDSKLDSK